MSTRSGLRVFRLGFAAIALSVACLLGWQLFQGVDTRSPASTPAVLRVGLNNWPGYEFAFLAEELGYFREEGVEVRLMEFSSLADVRRAFERGRLDGFFSTLHEVLESYGRGGRRCQIRWAVDTSDGADEIIADAKFSSLQALKGQRIAIEPGSVTEFVLTRGLELEGLKVTDVQLVPMSQLEMEAAIRSGEIAAMVTYPPVSLKLRTEKNFRVLFSTRDIPDEVIDVLAFDEAIVREYPKEIARFVRAFDRAVGYYVESPDDAIQRMAQRQRVAPADLALALREGIRLYRTSDQTALMAPHGSTAEAIGHLRRLMFPDRPVSKVPVDSFLARGEE